MPHVLNLPEVIMVSVWINRFQQVLTGVFYWSEKEGEKSEGCFVICIV